MILLYEVAKAGPYMTVYRDSDDPRLFYYIPEFGAIRRFSDGRLAFGAALYQKNPMNANDGFSLYNIGVVGVVPGEELQRTRDELEQQYGGPVTLSPIPAFDVSLSPITDGIYRSIKCQMQGGNIYTDLAASFTVDELLEPDFSHIFQSGVGWAGQIAYKVRTRKTSFAWKITANWRRIQEHFRAQASVKWWFIKTNLSYETQKLIENDTLHIDITGGTPGQTEKVYTFAEKIAARLFVPTLQPAPLPNHPEGAVVCLSLNFSKVEENRVSEWAGSESDFEERSLGMAVYVRDIPPEYFRNFDRPLTPDRDAINDTHALAGYLSPDEFRVVRPVQSASANPRSPRGEGGA